MGLKKIVAVGYLCFPVLALGSGFVVEDFEGYELSSRWMSLDDTEIISDCPVTAGTTSNDRCLRVKYRPTSRGSPRIVKFLPIPKHDHYILSYDVFFEPGFVFMLGGKLPGLGPAYPTSGCEPATDYGWSARSMWHEDGVLSSYYYDQERFSPCGDGEEAVVSTLTPGRWNRVELNVKLNSSGGDYDGHVITSINGGIVADDRRLRLRGNKSPESLIQQFIFSTFFGGDSPEWAPTHDVYARFDNFKVNPVGDLGAELMNELSMLDGSVQTYSRPNAPQLSVSLNPSVNQAYFQDFDAVDNSVTASDSHWKKHFFNTIWVSGASQGRVALSYRHATAGQSLRVALPPATSAVSESGFFWKTLLAIEAKTLDFSYRVYVPRDFEFGQGGQLPGVGYKSPIIGRDWRSILSWSSKGELNLELANFQGYVQHKIRYEQERPHLKLGAWNHLRMRIRMNDQGRSNGIIEVFQNNQKVGSLDRIPFTPDLSIAAPNRLRFDVYMQPNYGTSEMVMIEQYLWFDDIKITTSG